MPPHSHYLRHRLRRQVSEWAAIGANGKVLSWIQHGVAISWKRSPPPAFNQGVSLLGASPAQLAFLNTELSRLESEGAWENRQTQVG